MRTMNRGRLADCKLCPLVTEVKSEREKGSCNFFERRDQHQLSLIRETSFQRQKESNIKKMLNNTCLIQHFLRKVILVLFL